MGIMNPRNNETFRHGDRVISRTDRGLETSTVLCESSPEAIKFLDSPTTGQIVRRMSVDDINEQTHMITQEKGEFDICRQYVAKLKLDMQMVDIEHIFGGERIVIYYLAEARVDFRDLVKQLAHEFQTRIEMRQIGVRDEAKLMADYGDCGQTVCCNTHLIKMPPVSMKMAKLQKATLDPTKISGRCSRLKCCLRYEYSVYEELQKELPPNGAMVDTEMGRAKVLNQEVLAGCLMVETEDKRRVLLQKDEVEYTPRPKNVSKKKPKNNDNPDSGSK